MTILEETRKTIKTQQHQVLYLTQVSEMEYNEFQFQLGIHLLKSYLCNDKALHKMERDKHYWNWFKMRYQNHEDVVIKYLTKKNEFIWFDYKSKMIELINSKRTSMQFAHLLTLYKYIK